MTQIVERGTLMKVLDHGYVRIIDFMGKDESIVEAARMSTGRGFISWEPYERCKHCNAVWKKFDYTVQPGDGKPSYSLQFGGTSCRFCEGDTAAHTEKFPNGDLGLLDNLWRNKHATPFEMCELVLEVQAPIMVFREWHRHRTQSFNEFSARYAQMPNLHYLPEKNRIQKQSTANKQGSAESMDEVFALDMIEDLRDQQEHVYEKYDEAVKAGVAKEIARINTPVSRYSKMRAKGNLRNWLGMCNLRMRPAAQWEFRQYAEEVGKIINWLWPKTWSLFEEYDLYGASFSRTELNAIRSILLGGFGTGNGDAVKVHAQSVGLTGTKLKEFETKLADGGKVIL